MFNVYLRVKTAYLENQKYVNLLVEQVAIVSIVIAENASVDCTSNVYNWCAIW